MTSVVSQLCSAEGEPANAGTAGSKPRTFGSSRSPATTPSLLSRARGQGDLQNASRARPPSSQPGPCWATPTPEQRPGPAIATQRGKNQPREQGMQSTEKSLLATWKRQDEFPRENGTEGLKSRGRGRDGGAACRPCEGSGTEPKRSPLTGEITPSTDTSRRHPPGVWRSWLLPPSLFPRHTSKTKTFNRRF